MPSVSKKQRRAMAIAEHHPEMLYAKNKGLKKMSKKQLHEFASTSESHLPMLKKHMMKKKKRKKGASMTSMK